MKKFCLPFVCCMLTFLSYSQQTAFYTNPQERFNVDKEYFQKEQYNLAYPIFKELQESLKETDRINTPIVAQEVNYYTIVCSLKQNEDRSEEQAKEYIDLTRNNARVEMMNFH